MRITDVILGDTIQAAAAGFEVRNFRLHEAPLAKGGYASALRCGSGERVDAYQIGKLANDPNVDDRVKLEWVDGSLSDFIPLAELKRVSQRVWDTAQSLAALYTVGEEVFLVAMHCAGVEKGEHGVIGAVGDYNAATRDLRLRVRFHLPLAVEAMERGAVAAETLANFPDPCAVCQDEFAAGDEHLRMPCSHLFHKDCLMPWLRDHNTCPTCRHELPQAAEPVELLLDPESVETLLHVPWQPGMAARIRGVETSFEEMRMASLAESGSFLSRFSFGDNVLQAIFDRLDTSKTGCLDSEGYRAFLAKVAGPIGLSDHQARRAKQLEADYNIIFPEQGEVGKLVTAPDGDGQVKLERLDGSITGNVSTKGMDRLSPKKWERYKRAEREKEKESKKGLRATRLPTGQASLVDFLRTKPDQVSGVKGEEAKQALHDRLSGAPQAAGGGKAALSLLLPVIPGSATSGGSAVSVMVCGTCKVRKPRKEGFSASQLKKGKQAKCKACAAKANGGGGGGGGGGGSSHTSKVVVAGATKLSSKATNQMMPSSDEGLNRLKQQQPRSKNRPRAKWGSSVGDDIAAARRASGGGGVKSS